MSLLYLKNWYKKLFRKSYAIEDNSEAKRRVENEF